MADRAVPALSDTLLADKLKVAWVVLVEDTFDNEFVFVQGKRQTERRRLVELGRCSSAFCSFCGV